jgi:hypothetical protein
VRRVKYGFRLNETRDGYEVDEEQMSIVWRIFYMVGVEGKSHNAIMRLLEAEAVPTPGGGKRWDRSFFRACIFDDLYFPHTAEEVAAVVSPAVAADLNEDALYGLWWYSRLSSKTKQIREAGENGPVYRKETRRTKRDREEWVAVPVPYAGIPREIADAERSRIKDNRRPSTAGRRF